MRGNPRLCVYKDTVCLVTTRDDGKVLFAKSIDNGISWDSAVVIGEGRAHPSFKMSKSTSSYLALSVAASIVTEILFYKSTDAGITWSRGQFVSDNDGIGSQRPAMDIDDSTGRHITWYDYKYSPYPWTGDIFYRASRDSGNSWENIDSLTVVHRATVSDILAEGSNLHLVWQDDRHEFAENREIYYRTSSDLGQTWGAEVRLTDAPYHSMRPSLACGGGYLHLFWQDRRNYGNNSAGPLYYKRKDLSHSIAESNKSVSVTNCRCKLFPNPFSQILCIEHNTSAEQLKIKIFDVSGKEVTNYKTNDNTGEIKVDTKDLPCGVYFVKIEADGEKVIRKVVKIE